MGIRQGRRRVPEEFPRPDDLRWISMRDGHSFDLPALIEHIDGTPVRYTWDRQ
jgi:hypothetical protein